MSQTSIILPVAAQVLLTCIVLFIMAGRRSRSMHNHGKTAEDLALADKSDWDTAAQKASNNYINLFELPVLFYAVTAFALVTRTVDGWMLALAWAFVASRTVHSIVHVTTNIVRWRGSVFLVGFIALVAMWALLVWRVLQAGL